MNPLRSIFAVLLLVCTSLLGLAAPVPDLVPIIVDENTPKFQIDEAKLKTGCGPACLYYAYRLIFKRPCKLSTITALCHGNVQQPSDSLLTIKLAAEKLGMATLALKLTPSDLKGLDQYAIAHLTRDPFNGDSALAHYVLIVGYNGENLTIMDVNSGPQVVSLGQFAEVWSGNTLLLFDGSDPSALNKMRKRLCAPAYTTWWGAGVSAFVLLIVLCKWVLPGRGRRVSAAPSQD